ncbi:MAG TPA: RNA polymerase sigma factor [Candidatus Acidoferrales bacterium]|nr:RNA polymerase sigma factor [Candidatus Acidoferrales bacterium]
MGQNPEIAGPLELKDAELLRRAAEGDESAFAEFYNRHNGPIYRFALHMTGSPDSAADVTQETFMLLVREPGVFDPRRGEALPFLYGVARNFVRQMLSRDSRFVALPQAMPVVAPTNGQCSHLAYDDASSALDAWESLSQQESIWRLRQAILSLPTHYREVVTLCDLEGKTYSDAAGILDCPVGTVRSRLNRARDLLLEKLRPATEPRDSLRATGTGS